MLALVELTVEVLQMLAAYFAPATALQLPRKPRAGPVSASSGLSSHNVVLVVNSHCPAWHDEVSQALKISTAVYRQGGGPKQMLDFKIQ